jgi:N6-L-threonylcarbamoyladenine synthase
VKHSSLWPNAPGSGGPLVLAIESSCDETAAAVMDGKTSERASVVHMQIPLHARYGGVVPEIASRAHVREMVPVVEQALTRAGCGLRDLAAIAVTRGPGLGGALLVGVEYAKGLGMALDVPVVGGHHIEGQFLAAALEVSDGMDALTFPNLTLVISGGHTSLVHVERPGVYRLMGRTLDDAAGEAFDKASATMGLGYPGGRVIDELASEGDPEAIALPRPMVGRPGHDFSFSGLKTAFATRWRAAGDEAFGRRSDFAASFQEAVAQTLLSRTLGAAEATGVRHVVLSGGVASNRRVRSLFRAACDARGFRLSAPPPKLCTDNASMIGVAGYTDAWRAVEEGRGFEAWGLDAQGTWSIEDAG